MRPPLMHGVWNTASLNPLLVIPPRQVDLPGQAGSAPKSSTASGELRQKISSPKPPPIPGGPCTRTSATGVAQGIMVDMTHPPPKISNSTTPAAFVVPLRVPGGTPGGIPPHQATSGSVGFENISVTVAPGTGMLAASRTVTI